MKSYIFEAQLNRKDYIITLKKKIALLNRYAEKINTLSNKKNYSRISLPMKNFQLSIFLKDIHILYVAVHMLT